MLDFILMASCRLCRIYTVDGSILQFLDLLEDVINIRNILTYVQTLSQTWYVDVEGSILQFLEDVKSRQFEVHRTSTCRVFHLLSVETCSRRLYSSPKPGG